MQLNKDFEEFMAKVLPDYDGSPETRLAIKRTFYAGALCACTNILTKSPDFKGAAITLLDEIMKDTLSGHAN